MQFKQLILAKNCSFKSKFILQGLCNAPARPLQHSCKAFTMRFYRRSAGSVPSVVSPRLPCRLLYYSASMHALSTHPLYYLSSLADYCGARGSEIGEFSACDHLDDEISDGSSLDRTGKDFKACRLGG